MKPEELKKEIARCIKDRTEKSPEYIASIIYTLVSANKEALY